MRTTVSNLQSLSLFLQITIGFSPDTISAILYAGNMSFTPSKDTDSCVLDKRKAALACAALLGITFDGLASALTSMPVLAGGSHQSSLRSCF
jgi:myosin heavy subunit